MEEEKIIYLKKSFLKKQGLFVLVIPITYTGQSSVSIFHYFIKAYILDQGIKFCFRKKKILDKGKFFLLSDRKYGSQLSQAFQNSRGFLSQKCPKIISFKKMLQMCYWVLYKNYLFLIFIFLDNYYYYNLFRSLCDICICQDDYN